MFEYAVHLHPVYTERQRQRCDDTDLIENNGVASHKDKSFTPIADLRNCGLKKKSLKSCMGEWYHKPPWCNSCKTKKIP